MPIISIPSSIGGVSVPGSVINGPLGKLFGNKNTIENLYYPRDLGSATRGHWVQFSINEIKPIGYEEGKEYNLNSIYKGVENSVENFATGTKGVIETFNSTDGNIVDATKASFISGTEKIVNNLSKLTLRPKGKTLKAAINLYMPDDVVFTNASSYNSISLVSVAENVLKGLGGSPEERKRRGILGKIVGGVSNIGATVISAAQTDAGKLALPTQALALNPQNQVLFDTIDFRSFQMNFIFTPFSKDEAQTVKNIVKLFKTHAAPKLVKGAAGMFFIPPSTFNLQFMYNGTENANIPKIGECVIESIEVNYAPNGWSAHVDGAPVQTTLSLSLKEIELIDRDKIESKGY